MSILSLLSESFLFSIPQMAILIISVRYYIITKKRNAIYLSVGSLLVLINFLFSSISFYLLIEEEWDPLGLGVIEGIIGLLGITGGFLFAFGLRSLLQKKLTLLFDEKSNPINQIGKS